MKKNRKGFTLIEIIVVLVILAILAAATIPTMLKFVDNANGKALIAEARAAYLAAQMIATEQNAKGTTTAPTEEQIEKYLDDATATITVTMDTGNAAKVAKVVYTKNSYEVTINAGGTTDVKKVTE